MKASMRWLGLPLVVMLAACPRDTTQEDVIITDDPAAPAPEVPMPETAPPPDQVTMQTAVVEEVGGSGVSGAVTVTDRGDQTEFSVQVTGAPASATLPGHVHSGTCANIGGVVQPLESITTDAAGTGTATATAAIAPMTVMDGQHVVVYHDEAGSPIACAEVPRHAM
jgi:hypothetical protein